MPANTDSDDVEQGKSQTTGSQSKKLDSKLVYREGDDFAIFLNATQGPTGVFNTYEIADGPAKDPSTKYYSLPATVNGVHLEASDRDRGGEVARLFSAEQIMINKKINKPYKDEETGEMVTHRPFLVECRLVEQIVTGKTFLKLQPFVAYPIFRKDEKHNPDARPIGYRIPKEDTRSQAQDTQQATKEEGQDSKEDRYVTIWRKQGERGGKNIYLSIPEAYDIIHARKTIEREGVKVAMTGIKNNLVETSCTVQYSGGQTHRAQSYSRSTAPRTSPSSSAPQGSDAGVVEDQRTPVPQTQPQRPAGRRMT